MTEAEMKSSFEEWYSNEYAWEMKRSAGGRGGCSLKQYNGEYVSDHATNAHKVWCAAIKRMQR